jgi:hypothetical protein
MPDPELTDHYASILRAGFDLATGGDEPISDELDAESLRSLLLSADRLAEQLDHSIMDAPWLRSDVAKLVDEWVNQPGEVLDLTELRQALEPLFGPGRSLMIARTETANAFNGANAAGLRAHGWTQVTWIAAPDACPECAELDGEVMSIGEYEAEPTLHPNCSCTAEPYAEELEGEGEEEEEVA